VNDGARPGPRVVLFSGGRGSGSLAEVVATDSRVELTVCINGYDDGASTGEVRRFLGDALGPSDFRKNASRLARLRRTCPAALIDLLDRRLPDGSSVADLRRLADTLAAGELSADLPRAMSSEVASRLRRFDEEFRRSERPLNFNDASLGNFVFAGGFLACDRRFNAAVDDYCALVGLPPGLIENVTDGANGFLVALDDDGGLLGSEEEIVDARRRNRIREIFLIAQPFSQSEREALMAMPVDRRRAALADGALRPTMNPRLGAALQKADLIIYAPGTQHSSLFPSYLTLGLGEAIAANLGAVKLLVTNIQTDAEITGRSAVDLIDRAVFYLRRKSELSTPTPCLITHYLLNDPGQGETAKPYVPLGRLESLEDPRLVRVGNYEAGSSGRHDASKVLAPYIEAFIARERSVLRVAVALSDTRSPNKVAQTLIEMVRGGIHGLRVETTVLHSADAEVDPALQDRLGFPVRRVESADGAASDRALRAALESGAYDYVVLFDSSGMYNGEDIAGLASHLTLGRLDAVWGSRRLSVTDIQESYRLRYRDNALQGTISAIGSHVLSLQYLALYGRYVADTLSGARVVRAADALRVGVPLTHKLINHYLLSSLLRRQADVMEIPVQFFAMSPNQARRTSVGDGLRSIGIAIRERIRL
jgi:2-phospho-L-lactate transferase/gluconeogenesis factor (CofD/UPF0052 family)